MCRIGYDAIDLGVLCSSVGTDRLSEVICAPGACGATT